MVLFKKQSATSILEEQRLSFEFKFLRWSNWPWVKTLPWSTPQKTFKKDQKHRLLGTYPPKTSQSFGFGPPPASHHQTKANQSKLPRSSNQPTENDFIPSKTNRKPDQTNHQNPSTDPKKPSHTNRPTSFPSFDPFRQRLTSPPGQSVDLLHRSVAHPLGSQLQILRDLVWETSGRRSGGGRLVGLFERWGLSKERI